jgi:anti-anti-sigma factor
VVEYREERRSDDVCVLSVEGELDLAAVAEFREHALACLDAAGGLELDLHGVSFIDSSGLAGLVRVRKEADLTGKSLSLVNVSRATRRLLEITGLENAFDIRPAHD